MAPKTQAYVVGGVAGVATWLLCFAVFVKAKQPQLERYAQEIAPGIAEQAALSYIATRYGLTREIMQRIQSRVGLITGIFSAGRSA